MPKARVNDCEIYYEVHGEGTPLLLVAGLGGTGSYWHPQIKKYAEHFQVIIHDHRGTGQSTRSEIEYSVEQMTDDLVALMDALGVEKAHLLGHSTGGAIGQVMAIDYPERLHSAVIYASWTRSDPFLRRVMEMRKDAVLTSGPEAYARATPVFLYPDWWINENAAAVEELDRRTVANFPSVSIAASRCDAVINFDRVSELHKIQTPTLVICARDDFLTPAYFSTELAERIPGAQLVFLERGGHACSQTMADEFDDAVLAFLLDQDSAVRSASRGMPNVGGE